MSNAFSNYPHYFGDMSRQDAEMHLRGKKVGTFLLRKSSRPRSLVISLAQSKTILHLLVLELDTDEGGGWCVDPIAWKGHEIDGKHFLSLELLIEKLRDLRMLGKGLNHEGEETHIGDSLSSSSASSSSSSSSSSIISSSSSTHSISSFLPETLKQDTHAQAVDMNLLGLVGKEELQRIFNLNKKNPTEILCLYREFLNGILCDSQISKVEKKKLEQYRKENNISDQQHQVVLESLYITTKAFDELLSISEQDVEEKTIQTTTTSTNSTNNSKDMCIICDKIERQGLFSPCGHLVCCFNCANQITKCPRCQGSIVNVIRVYF